MELIVIIKKCLIARLSEIAYTCSNSSVRTGVGKSCNLNTEVEYMANEDKKDFNAMLKRDKL